jgi:hypothetical protein
VSATAWFDNATAPPGRAPLHAPAIIVIALALAALTSTQFLFQPFVWRNWPVDEVLLGWRDYAGQRALTAAAIAVALIAVRAVPLRHPPARAVLTVVAIAVGAGLGELGPLALDPGERAYGFAPALRRGLQTTVFASGIVALITLWRQAAELNAAVRAAELRRARSEQQHVELSLQAMRSRIEPHFLFNTLATVLRLLQTRPPEGAALLDHLVSYLRWSQVSARVQQIRLGQEADLVEAYLAVVSTRMSGRLRAQCAIPAELRDCLIPPLVVATLVENAIQHGIAPAPEGGSLRVEARARGETLELVVADTGVGFSETGGSGIGLANIRARLATLYGAAGGLRIANGAPHGVRAQVDVPLRRTESAP